LNSRLPKVVFIGLVAYVVVYFSSCYRRLPEVLASHFSAQGQPNGWESKPVFFAVFAGAVAIAALIGIGGPWLVRVLPPELINLPNKEKWLGPANRERTLEFLESSFAWFGCGLLVLLILTFDYAVQANLHPKASARATRFWYYLAGFSTFAVIWIIRLTTKFGVPRNSGNKENSGKW
jgi:Protein of unknown function (DUF1648)